MPKTVPIISSHGQLEPEHETSPEKASFSCVPPHGNPLLQKESADQPDMSRALNFEIYSDISQDSHPPIDEYSSMEHVQVDFDDILAKVS
eukprot:354144-Karenia_brevis.AAC.1